jgi:hypothetical protein
MCVCVCVEGWMCGCVGVGVYVYAWVGVGVYVWVGGWVGGWECLYIYKYFFFCRRISFRSPHTNPKHDPHKQEPVPFKGHAIEARVYAEDPLRGFLPSTGQLVTYKEPRHLFEHMEVRGTHSTRHIGRQAGTYTHAYTERDAYHPPIHLLPA